MRIVQSTMALLLLAACGPAPDVVEPTSAPAPLERVETRATPPLHAHGRGGFRAYEGAQFTAGSLYEGHYLCSQGETGMALRVDEVRGHRVAGVFSFFHEPTGVRGSFVIEGELSPRGEIVFQPREWIEHPENYVAVPFRLSLTEDGQGLSGSVMHASCGSMEAHRVSGR